MSKVKTKVPAKEPPKLFQRQRDLVALISECAFVLAYGSSRGGKSFCFLLVLFIRALAFPGSNHCVIRQTAASIPSTIWPTAMEILSVLDPNYRAEVDINKSLHLITLHNGSTIWFFGAQDEEQILKIMGSEYATMFLNEVEKLDYKVYQRAVTRLNSNVVNKNGERIKLKFFADCNPKAKSHWVYQQWIAKVRPGTKIPLEDSEEFGWLQFDAEANPGVDPSYYRRMRNFDAEEQASYLRGEWYDEVQGAYFSKKDIDDSRDLPPDEFDIIGIGVDPAMTATPTSDETGIFVCGMKLVQTDEGEHRHYYPIADYSGRYHPHEWGELVAKAYRQHRASFVVVEINQGGNSNVVLLEDADASMNILTVRPGKGQGKNMRVQPIAKVMKAGRIHHPFPDESGKEVFEALEDQMLIMTGDYDRNKGKSPDRLDAYGYCISELLTGDHFAKPVVVSKIAGWFR